MEHIIKPAKKAFDAKSLLRIIGECEQGDSIVFKKGKYYFSSPENAVKLKNITKKITFKAENGVRFIGGKPLFETDPVKNGNVYCVDLIKNGVSPEDTGNFVSRGFARPVKASHAEIFANGFPLNLSRYPKNGYLKITGYAEEEINEWAEKVGKLEKGFYYNDDQPNKWAEADDILVHGYWSWDWANSYETIDTIEKNPGKITTKAPYGHYAFKPGQRFNFYNILEEVTENGDYYIDRKNMKLYFIPFDQKKFPDEILISTLDEPLWNIEKCENLCFEDFFIEASRGCGIMIESCKNIKISNCEFKNIGNYPVTINKSFDITVENCDIHDCGDGGICISCGNRATLESGNIKIDNNHIYKIAKWSRTYQTAINASGVGITIINNLIHDCPHTGILFWGNEICIKNNEIYSALLETGDAGAVYTGRDYTYRGNIVSNNYIHHMGGVGMGTMGIYNDDCVSGTVMEKNLFFEVQRAVFLGGGRDFNVTGNLFIDCHPSIEIDGRGTSSHKVWRKMVGEFMRDRFYNIKEGEKTVSAAGEPYISRYPELTVIDGFYAKNLPVPPSAKIEKNVYCSKQKLEFTWEYEPGEFIINKNKSISRDYFEDYEIGYFNIKDNTDAEMYGFERFDMLAYGLDEKRRKKNPPRVLTGLLYDGKNLIYRYKNFSNQKIRAKIVLYSAESDFDFFEITIGENAGGSVKIPFEQNTAKSNIIDARSENAGIRPCRINI